MAQENSRPRMDDVEQIETEVCPKCQQLKRVDDECQSAICQESRTVRRVSWSPDGKYIYAAVADTDADIVLLDGLLP
jgi:hypothetical protein